MNENQRFVLQDAVKAVIDEEVKYSRTKMKGRLEAAIDDGFGSLYAEIGDIKAEIKLHAGSITFSPSGEGAEFLDFLESKGMTVRAPAPGWEDECALVGDAVVWKDTGEVVPGARVEMKETASYPQVVAKRKGKVIPKRDRMKLIDEARRVGLIGDVPLIGGSDEV